MIPDPRRLSGRLFYLLISVLLACGLTRAQAPSTTVVQDVVYKASGEPASGHLVISWAAFTTAESIASRDIVDEEKFRDGLSKIIDGTVQCLNASTWAKVR